MPAPEEKHWKMRAKLPLQRFCSDVNPRPPPAHVPAPPWGASENSRKRGQNYYFHGSAVMSTHAPARARAHALRETHHRLWPPWASLQASLGLSGEGRPFGGLFSGTGPLEKSGFPICELLIKLATFWPGATGGLLEAFFGEDPNPFRGKGRKPKTRNPTSQTD